MFLLRKLDPQAIKIFDIDFKRPWWSLIVTQKWLFAFVIFSMVIVHGFWFVTPFLIELLFQTPTAFVAGVFFTSWIAVDCLHLYARTVNARFQLQCIHSIYKSAHTYLLTIDPMYHIHRSSGALLAKIERGARGYEELLDQITFELTPLLVGLIIMIIALYRYSPLLALFEALLFASILLFSYLFARYGSQRWEKVFIKSDDMFKATAVENLSQVHMVRSLFASDYMDDALNQKVQSNSESERGLWLSYSGVAFLLNTIYFSSIVVLLVYLAYQVKRGAMSGGSALGLAIAYTQSTKAIVSVISRFRRYIRGWAGARDLFDAMAHFGKQGYPVLGPAQNIERFDRPLSVTVDKISFNYETARLFNEHSFKVSFFQDKGSMLIGIIGASGTGKSTFLSILGGQLKPKSGTVKINDVDIYTLNDATRRTLIALQGQIATSVRGTVKYNMLFGLPKDHGFDDQKLLDILNRVGLLTILQNHNGLDTMLGEGGLSLSGGQRQRLNFAALYLRSIFYRPALILIDEPTSSLDEVSEAAITTMIMELAAFAITFVIAHRLKTIEKAVGLIDLSLLKDDHEIKLYSSDELEERSAYYKQLRQGKVSLNS